MEKIILAAPRGFCAGVAYAIEVVDLALRIHGAPLYVRHAIVHNEWVVRSFEERGVIFVERIDEIPAGAPVVFSAHGVSPEVRREAAKRNLHVIDATCPLVTKVHNEAKHYAAKGYFMIYIGHAGHVEAEGTMGEAPERMVLVETPEDAEKLQLQPAEKLAVLTQTTLSVEEVRATLEVLHRRFPHLETPKKEDICYATTNRQVAIRELAKQCDLVLIVGSATSSNSNRLREVAEGLGVESHLLLTAEEIKPEWREGHRIIGISSGASTPEGLVEEVIGGLLQGRSDVPVSVLETVREDMSFKPPRDLIQLRARKLMARHLAFDSDGTIVEPKLEGLSVCGITHLPSGRLSLWIADGAEVFRLEVPGIRRVFTMTDPELGSALAFPSTLFEARYAPVTEETVIAIREAYDEHRQWDESWAREVRASKYALEWWTSYGTDGVAVGDAEPAELAIAPAY